MSSVMSVQVDDFLRLLRSYSLVHSVRVVNYDETPQGKLELKLRCRLAQEYQLQIWIHAEPQLLDYAYQLFSTRPVLRWDNVPHYPDIATVPHHFHDEQGQVMVSPLSGDPLSGIQLILAYIIDCLTRRRARD
jgi:hypothetical protein